MPKQKLLEALEPEVKPELDDVNFMEGMKALLGLEDEQVEALLDELDSQSLVALADAIAKKDKLAAKRIIGSFEDELSSLFRGKNLEPPKQNEEDEKKKPSKPPKDYEFSIGDDVAIRTPKTNEETGEEEGDKFVSATVYKPHAPGNTIGVKIDGKSKMVNREDVYMLKEDKLEEMVLGMTNMPDLGRMQQLAGIQSQAPAVEIEQVAAPQNDQPAMYDREEECEMNDMAQCLGALDTLENALPNIRLADVKTIRARVNGLINKMNETLSPGRAKKL